MAMKPAVLIALALVAVVATAGVCSARPDEAGDFDFWMLSMYWAPSVCLGTTACCQRNACCRTNAPIKFVIQGLWPDYKNGSFPSFCDCNKKFELAKIASLIPQLEGDWPFLDCETSQLCEGKTKMAWASQWEKHGTCGTLDQYSYFLKALRLYNDYNVLNVINEFPPSNNELHRFRNIVESIKTKVGAAPLIVCNSDSIRNVRLCFDKDFNKPIDCDHTGFDCPKYVKIPTYGPLALNAEL